MMPAVSYKWILGNSQQQGAFYSHFDFKFSKVNRCLARYSPRATTTSQPINRAPNEPAMVRNANFGLNLVVFEQKI